MHNLTYLTDQFYDFLEHDKRDKLSTINWHKKCHKHFFKVCNIKEFKNITPEIIRKFKKIKSIDGIEKDTIHQYLRSLRTLCRWLYEEEYVDEYLFDARRERKKVCLPNLNKKPPKLIERKDLRKIENILDVFPYYQTHLEELRTKALIYNYMHTGMRKMEALNIKMEYLKLNERTVLLLDTKTNDYRPVIINDVLSNVLKSYLDYLKELNIKNKYLFFNSDPLMPMSEGALRWIKEKIEAFGIRRFKIKAFNLNWFRHSYITFSKADGLPESFIMSQVGHTRPETTQRYTHMPEEGKIALANYSITKC